MPEGDYGCYWQRNDSSGNIIDNNLTSGARMQVTISSSDNSFTSELCEAEWQSVG